MYLCLLFSFNSIEFVLFIFLLINDLSFSIDINELFFNDLSKDYTLIFVVNLSLLKIKSWTNIIFSYFFSSYLSKIFFSLLNLEHSPGFWVKIQESVKQIQYYMNYYNYPMLNYLVLNRDVVILFRTYFQVVLSFLYQLNILFLMKIFFHSIWLIYLRMCQIKILLLYFNCHIFQYNILLENYLYFVIVLLNLFLFLLFQ